MMFIDMMDSIATLLLLILIWTMAGTLKD